MYDRPQALAIDPVCGTTIDIAQARAAGLLLESDRLTRWFCGNDCLSEFRGDPSTCRGLGSDPPPSAVPPATTIAMTDPGWDATSIPALVAHAERQHAKDAMFIDGVVVYLGPGPVLEIGAGVGQLCRLLVGKGLEVIASDLEPSFVEYMAAHGLHAIILDALDLPPADGRWGVILSQGLSTLITRDLDLVARTYVSGRRALDPGGRFVVILPRPWQGGWSSARDHERIAAASGFRLVRHFRHQALPSRWYARLPAPILRGIDGTIGRVVGVRSVFVFEAV